MHSTTCNKPISNLCEGVITIILCYNIIVLIHDNINVILSLLLLLSNDLNAATINHTVRSSLAYSIQLGQQHMPIEGVENLDLNTHVAKLLTLQLPTNLPKFPTIQN